jgi:hypothetical protein
MAFSWTATWLIVNQISVTQHTTLIWEVYPQNSSLLDRQENYGLIWFYMSLDEYMAKSIDWKYASNAPSCCVEWLFPCRLHFYILRTRAIASGIVLASRSTVPQIFHPIRGNVLLSRKNILCNCILVPGAGDILLPSYMEITLCVFSVELFSWEWNLVPHPVWRVCR